MNRILHNLRYFIKYFVIIFLMAILITICIAVHYRKQTVHWLIQSTAQRILKDDSHFLKFKVSDIGLNKIIFRNIQLKKTSIPYLEIHFLTKNLVPTSINYFSFQAETLDIDEFKRISKKLSNPDNSSKEEKQQASFTSLKNSCQKIQTFDFKANINNLLINEKLNSLNIRLEHKRNKKNVINLNLVDFSLPFLDGDLQSSLHCLDDNITLNFQSINTTVKDLYFSKKVRINNGFFVSQNAKIILHKDDQLSMQLPFDLSGQGMHQNSSFYLALSSSLLSINTKKELAEVAQLPLKINYTLSDFSLNFSESLSSSPIIQNIQSSGSIDLNSNKYQALINLNDSSNSLSFKNIKISYFPETSDYQFVLQKSAKFFLRQNLYLLFPFIEDIFNQASGDILIAGNLKKNNQSIIPQLQVHGNHLNLSTQFLNLTELNFNHKTISFPQLSTPKNQRVSLQELTYGPTLKDLQMNYQVINKETIFIENLTFDFAESKISAQNFSINPQKKSVKDLLIKTKNLKLERLLKLALKNTINAQGILSGYIRIPDSISIDDLKKHPANDKKYLIATGQLKSTGPGWIRYRPPGVTIPSPGEFSASPMTLLNSYLYDFHYDSLIADLSIDQSYDMKVTLSTTGKNPSYLPNLPLKLNINLEQNLLVPIKAMMLTYHLPDQIKEKVEKIGTQ